MTEKKTLPCPINGLIYTAHIADTHTYYTLSPDAQHKMRVRSLEYDAESNTFCESDAFRDTECDALYLQVIAFPTPYDFGEGAYDIRSEAI